MYTTFIKKKLMYNLYRIETNGIIFRGHGGKRAELKENDILEKWASVFYGFSDFYGVSTNYPELLIDPVYFHPRISLFYYKTIEEMKESIDKDIHNNKGALVKFKSITLLCKTKGKRRKINYWKI